MIEDKLTHDERVRLECITQAVNLYSKNSTAGRDIILVTARVFEEFVKTGA